MLQRLAPVILFFSSFMTCTSSAAPDIQPVPGSGAGFMYFPGEDDARVVLKVIKETEGGLDTNYEVHLTFENNASELLCADVDMDCEKTLSAGAFKLDIVGEWITGKPWLAKHGQFSGACSGISTACNSTLQGGGTHTVHIKVGCNAHEYSKVSLGGGDEALCIGWGPGPSQNENKLLLAAHKKITSDKKGKTAGKVQWNAWSWEDGQENSEIGMNNWSGVKDDSAAYYCDDLQLGAGASKLVNWYLPAISELHLALNGWPDEDFIISKTGNNQTYISSTTGGGKKKDMRGIAWESSNPRQWKLTPMGSTICTHAVD